MAKQEKKKEKRQRVEKISVRFRTSASGYNQGDIAGFFPKKALQLVKSGVAVYTSKKDAEVAASERRKVAQAKEEAAVAEQQAAAAELAQLQASKKEAGRETKVVI